MLQHIERLKREATLDPSRAADLLRVAQRRQDETLITHAWGILYRQHRERLTLPEESSVAHYDTAQRACVICERELTDPASREHGVGPVCRGRSNALLARTIEADLEAAAQLSDALRPMLASCHDAARPFLHAAFAQLEEAGEHPRRARRDWRDVIKVFELALSYPTTPQLREGLEDITLALGYVALVHLWRDDVVKGKATLTFNAACGVLVLKSPRARSLVVREAVARAGGFYFSREGAFLFPATSHRDVRALIKAHWLNVKGGPQAVLGRAADWAPPPNWHAPTTWKDMHALVTGRPTRTHTRREGCTVTACQGGAQIATPYRRAFVQRLKTLPDKARRWNREQRVWWVSDDVLSRAVEIVRACFPDTRVEFV